MGNRHKLIPVMVVPPTVPVVLMLIDSENAGNEFISIAAHELRNPIQPILGLAGVVRNKSIDSEQKQMLDIITRNARKLKNLSDTILEVSRAEKNTLKLNPEKIAIVQLILDNVQEYQKYIDSIGKKVSIEYENKLGSEGYTVYAIPSIVQLNNL